MVRTQLQIDEDVYEALRVKAHRERKSMSAVVRDILRDQLGVAGARVRARRGKLSFVSSGASGLRDTSVRHDEALAEDFR